jgi:hypothetical protein
VKDCAEDEVGEDEGKRQERDSERREKVSENLLTRSSVSLEGSDAVQVGLREMGEGKDMFDSPRLE